MTPSYSAELPWWRKHPEATERVRPATVEEQVSMFKRTGGEVHEFVRVVRWSDWHQTEGQWVAFLRWFAA